MRGGVSAHEMMYNMDIEDSEIISKIVEENVEATNKTGMPLL